MTKTFLQGIHVCSRQGRSGQKHPKHNLVQDRFSRDFFELSYTRDPKNTHAGVCALGHDVTFEPRDSC